MKINFIGNFQNGYSGEVADETHISRSFQELGHQVREIPRDEWREHVRDDKMYPHIPIYLEADINIICKWHHFDGREIEPLRRLSKAPVIYWQWDSVDLDIEWHRKMAQEADLYLSGELGRAFEMRQLGIKFYYFQFDCVDWATPLITNTNKIYDVSYLGSYDNQRGRMDLLKEINKQIPIHVWGNGDWKKEGFIAHSPVYGEQANEIISQSKVMLGTSCDPHLFGYWSNRVGRILRNGGLLLQQYTPGMESFLHDYVQYFSTPREAIEKIKLFLQYPYEPETLSLKQFPDTDFFTSKQKVKDFCIMIERYLKEDHGKDWKLP